MGLFSSKGGAEKKLEAARANCDRLTEQLAAAQALILERKSTIRKLAFDGADDAERLAAGGKVREAEVDVEALSGALDDAKTHLASLEAELAQLADKKLRGETATAIDALASELEASITAWDTETAKLVETSRRAAEIVLDAHGLCAFAMAARAEAPAAAQMIAQELRNRVKATLDGRAPSAMPPAPPALVVDTPRPAPQRRQFFVLQPGMFSDATGAMRRAPRYSFIELNPQQAAHAIRMKGVCEPADPRVKEFKKFAAGATQQPPEPHLCQNWNDGSPPRGDAELVVHSKFTQSLPFQQLDRGPPYAMAVRVTPAVASRAEDENE
ncbi:MAG: hypothetical protein ACLPTZ_07195 [Beijerinckiaceae bacterium]